MDHAVSWGMDRGMDHGVWIVCGPGTLIHALYLYPLPHSIVMYSIYNMPVYNVYNIKIRNVYYHSIVSYYLLYDPLTFNRAQQSHAKKASAAEEFRPTRS